MIRRLQRNLEGRVMRTRRSTSVEQSASRPWWKLQPGSKVKVEPKIVRWNRCRGWEEKVSSWWIEASWEGVQVSGLGFLWKTLSRHGAPAAKLLIHEVQEAWKSQHPQSRFTFSEESFVPSYCGLFFGKPTPKEAFYNIQVVNRCEDHRVKIKDHEKNKEWARKAKEDIEFQKEALQEDVRLADKGSKYQDELIRDLTEGFLAGEFIDRNLESVGSSSKALTVLVWRELA